ncbi:MAG: hypothetical protein ABJJ84_06730 [Anderseniella sp.]
MNPAIDQLQVHFAHASCLAAALREGAHRAAAGRPCLSTDVLGPISLTPAAWRLRSARAHSVQRPVGLASALTCFGLELIVKAGSGSENGPPQADKLFDQLE